MDCDDKWYVLFPVTAFDMVRDPFKSLEDLIGIGVERLLTSGLDTSVLEGLPTIQLLVSKVCLSVSHQGNVRIS